MEQVATILEIREEIMRIEGENLDKTENPIVEELGEPKRSFHRDAIGAVKTQNSISNKEKKEKIN